MISRLHDQLQAWAAAKRKRLMPTTHLLRLKGVLERASGWGTLVILLGISIEIWTFFGLAENDPRQRLVALVANCFIALGLLIEYAAVRLTVVASDEAKQESDRRLSEAHRRILESEQRVAEAILSIQMPHRWSMQAASSGEAVDPGLVQQGRHASIGQRRPHGNVSFSFARAAAPTSSRFAKAMLPDAQDELVRTGSNLARAAGWAIPAYARSGAEREAA